MGTLFPDSPEHPDHQSIPSGLNLPVGTLTLTAYVGLLPLCPLTHHTDELPHADHAPQSMVALTPASSTGASGDLSANIGENLKITGHAPTVVIG
jgi:hypothetical protein